MITNTRATPQSVTHRLLSCARSIGALLPLVGLLALSAGASAQPNTRVTVSPGGERISISSSGSTRGELLEVLRTKYHIEVRPYLEPDQRVSIRVENVPIDSAIALIMPRGSHYAVRFGERDIARTARANANKTGPKETRAPGLGPKTEGRIVRQTGPRFKPNPERVIEPPARREGTVKPAADANLRVPPGRGPKIARPMAASPDSTLRITFIMRAPDSVRVTGARMIDGITPASTIVRGPFVFVLRSSAGVIYYGTLIDPLEEHSYENTTSNEHALSRAREGTFGISIPTQFAKSLTDARIEFYDATNASLPANLDQETLGRILARSKRVAFVDGRAVIAALREGTPR